MYQYQAYEMPDFISFHFKAAETDFDLCNWLDLYKMMLRSQLVKMVISSAGMISVEV